MKTYSTMANGQTRGEALSGMLPPGVMPGFLHLVTPCELQELRDALLDGRLPRDLDLKLTHLAGGSLLHRFVEQNCRLIIALLIAAYSGSFREANRPSLERLLRVLAYVRKDDDANPDYRPDGFVDDQQEIRAMLNEMGDLLQFFKIWRLRNQVPEMWRS
jgi:hypothetical protein